MSTCVDQASRFFKLALLPELIGKMFSRPSQTLSSVIDGSVSESMNYTSDDSEPPICYCRQLPSGRMVGCDNKSCKYE